MRTLKTTWLLFIVVLLRPAPAQAWFDWLDNLSGPGHFSGVQFDFNLFCLMKEAPRSDLVTAVAAANSDYKGWWGRLTEDERARVRVLPGSINQGSFDQFETQVGTARTLAEALNASRAAHDFLANTSSGLRILTPPGIPAPAAPNSPGVPPSRTATAQPLANGLTLSDIMSKYENAVRHVAVPRRSKLPGAVVFASCSDRLHNEPSDFGPMQHGDRSPLMSIVVNYRDISNAGGILLLWSEVAGNDNYANGDTIHLRTVEGKVSVPVWVPKAGRLEYVDFQSGAGFYHFGSAGFKEDAKGFTGLLLEPLRFDFHFPARWSDHIEGDGPGVFFKRLGLSVSGSVSWLMFPAGFTSDQFNPKPEFAKDLPGSELVREFAVVINVGRLFGL